MQAIHFGAGNIGRGFIGILLKNSNYDITFVDLNKYIIDDIKQNGEFSVIYLDEDNSSDLVDNVKGLHGIDDLGQVIETIGSTDLITTSLGQDNLKYITANIVAGIKARIDAGTSKNLDIIACENGLQVSSFFKQLVYAELTEEEQAYCDEHIGFVDCTVDRIVPNQTNENICDVRVEPSFEWVLKSNQVKANFDIEKAQYTEELAYYNKRKLLTVNLTHSLIGYVGSAEGYEFVHEAIANPAIEHFVGQVLTDIRNALVIEFGVEADVQDSYALKTVNRFKNDKIVDELSRVARNPLTKLSDGERYISPLKVLIDNGGSYDALCQAVAYGLSYDNPQEPQAVEIKTLIAEKGLEVAIKQITGLEDDHAIKVITETYNQINN